MKRETHNIIRDYLAVFGLLILTIGALILIFRITDKFNDPIEINFENVYENKKYGDLEEFLILGKRFADNQNYTRNVYDCENYSNDLHFIAKKLGYKTKRVIGCPKNMTNKSICHQFIRLEVDIESQNAEIVDYSQKYPIQRVLDK